jgi:prepilin-type N-terminal cleavage/methylation domain-containing protein
MNFEQEKGFSLIELLVVISIIAIMTVVGIVSFTRGKELYKTDDQALQIIDMLHEARFRALSQRETMRVEISITNNQVRIIDENTSTTADDDKVIRTLYLSPQTSVKLNPRPAGFSASPTTPVTCPDASFTTSNHPLSSGQTVAVFRFNMLGQVLNGGNNATGQNSVVTSSTITLWPPKKTAPTQADQTGLIRAIQIIGNSGAIQLWKYNGTQYVTN